jgi:energy-coupling factor transport system permease protein
VVLFLAVVIYLSHVPPTFIFKGLKGVLFIILLSVTMHLFMTGGETVLFSFGYIRLTLEGVKMAALFTFRLCFLIVGSSMLTLTTSPIQLTDGIEFLLKPLSKVGVPSHEIAMMMTIALRFIPTLLEETDKIMKAQMARGADFSSGGLIKRAKAMLPLLTPLFISSFRRADDLAMAMESRCYNGGDNRTKLKIMKFAKADLIAALIMCFYTAFIIVIS